jgi:hypothetical protein
MIASVVLILSGGSEARMFVRGKSSIKSAAGVLAYKDVLGKVTRVVRGNPVVVYLQ